MTTISSTFTDVGTSSPLYVRAGSSMTFALTNTWVGTVILEHSQNNGISWNQLGIYTANANSGFTLLPPGRIRYRCTAYTSGTVSYTMANVAEVESTFQNSMGVTVLSITDTGISTVDLAASGNVLITGTLGVTGTTTLGALDATSIGATTKGTGAFTTISATGAITSTLATGTAPFTVASTTVVANLNASALGGATFAAPGAIGGTTPAAGAFTTLSATGAITSTLATGTAPFTVASTTVVANLNASALGGATFAAPGAIGGTTPAAGSFTTLTATSTLKVSGVTALGSTTTLANFICNLPDGTALSSSSAVGGLRQTWTVPATATAAAYGTYTFLSTAAAAFTCAQLHAHVADAANVTVGAASAITRLSGFTSFQGTPATSNYGFVHTASANFTTMTAGNFAFFNNTTDPVQTGVLWTNEATLMHAKTTLTNGAAAQVGTLTNGPAAGNPTKWIPIDDTGTTRYLPAW